MICMKYIIHIKIYKSAKDQLANRMPSKSGKSPITICLYRESARNPYRTIVSTTPGQERRPDRPCENYGFRQTLGNTGKSVVSLTWPANAVKE